MRVFVTGATGWVGSAVVRDLLTAGHEVVGLARSETAAAALTGAGARAHRGSLDDLDALRRAAAAADGVIHLAFQHDFSDYGNAVAIDLRAVQAIGAVLDGSGKPFVNTSGTLMVSGRRLATEADTGAPGAPRVASEDATIALAERGVRSAVVRLAPTVHGRGDHGFVPRLIDIARDRGVSAYVGDGENRWPAVHRLDAARLYRLALESAPAGVRLHGVDDEGVPFREIAGVIGRQLGLPVQRISPDEAGAHFGFLGPFVQLDNPTSNALTRKQVEWQPEQPGLIADLEAGHYFA